MKRIIKITAVIQVILLYGFLASPYNSGNVLPVTGFPLDDERIPLNESLSFISASLFNALPSENQAGGFNIIPNPSLKEYTDDYRVYHRTLELLIIHFFSDYILYSGNIAPGLPKTVIAFPFHYFW